MTMPKVRQLLVVLAGLAIVALGVAIAQRSVSYVATQGSSMEPGIHEGDLAVVRAVARYEPGDVVAYQSDHLDTVVMHRIVQRDGDRYVLQGDNNTWLDSDRPSHEQLLGRLWLRVPEGGRVLGWVSAPWPLLAAGSALSVFVGVKAPRGRRRTPGRARHVPRQRATAHTHRRAKVSRTAGFASVGLVTVSAVLALMAFSQPTHGPTRTEIAYTQRGAFEYSAAAARGAAYPDGTVTTGDPVFRQLVSAVDVDFTYEVHTDAAVSLDGQINLRARISDSTGWQRTVALAPATSLGDSDGEAKGTLDLDRMQSLIDDLARTTGVRSGTHTVELIADVDVTGRLAGQPVTETFSSELPFHLDPLQLRPAWEGTGDDVILRPSSAGDVSVLDRGANRVTVLGTSVEVASVRWAAGAAAMAAAMLLVTAIACRIRRADESARIASRYGDRIVEVAPSDHLDRSVVDVATMNELARLAAHHDTLILHERDGGPGENHYLFHHDRTVYRYTAPPSCSLATGPPERESVSERRRRRSRAIRRERPSRTPSSPAPAHAITAIEI